LLENWPKFNGKLVDINTEKAMDGAKDIISIVNSARMKAKFKRRWPVKDVIIFAKDRDLLDSNELLDILKKQLNTVSLNIKSLDSRNSLEKINALYPEKLITLNAKLKINKIAPRLKRDLNKALRAFEMVNYGDLFGQLMSKDKFTLKYESGEIDLSKDDVEFTYNGESPYVMVESEQENIVVFIDTTRSNELIALGLMTDIARNIQQLRKEKGFVPTEILSSAYISKLEADDVASLENHKQEMSYYVRVKSVVITQDKLQDIDYKEIEIDGKKILISIK
jgi:isoleucyl-tRNA synthetase